MADNQTDLVILGGGSGGYACALRASQLGLSVTLIEGAQLGGTCLHRGCIPTKALLHSAEIADAARESEAFGVETTLTGINMPKVLEYKSGVIGRLYKGLQGLVKSRGVNYVQGWGKLTGPNTVEVDGTTYTGKSVVLGTGSYARSIPGLEIDGRILSSDEALELTEVPSSAIVLGGGVIGVEFASIWNSFGAEVTIVEALPRLVANEDEACSKALERAFRKRGITAKTGIKFASATQDDQGVHVILEDGSTLDADYLLIAIGRGPKTDGMGYAEVGVAMDRGFVTVDENLQTSVPGVYAVGDIVPGPQLAHRGFAQGIYLAEYLAGQSPVPIVESGIPRVTYCDPEVASVGLTEAQAKSQYGESSIKSIEYNLGGNGKSQILGTAGFVKLVALDNGQVIGVHLVGARVGELIGEGELIVNWEADADDVASLIHAHPSQSEAIGEAHLALAGKPLHAHA